MGLGDAKGPRHAYHYPVTLKKFCMIIHGHPSLQSWPIGIPQWSPAIEAAGTCINQTLKYIIVQGPTLFKSNATWHSGLYTRARTILPPSVPSLPCSLTRCRHRSCRPHEPATRISSSAPSLFFLQGSASSTLPSAQDAIAKPVAPCRCACTAGSGSDQCQCHFYLLRTRNTHLDPGSWRLHKLPSSESSLFSSKIFHEWFVYE